MHEVTRALLYGLLAAASPIAVVATLVVLTSGRGRAHGAVFAAAFVVRQAAAFVALIVRRQWAEGVLARARTWLEAHGREVAAGVVVISAGLLLRNGITGLTS